MANLKNMNLEQLIEYDNKHPVLPKFKLKYNKINNFYPLLNISWNTYLSIYENYRQNLPIKKEITRLYNNLLDDLIIELKESPFNKDPLTLAILLGDYLIPSGILSYTKKFHTIPQTKEWIKITSYDSNYHLNSYSEGLYVTAGYGCCRHFNSLICDIFTKFNIKNDKLCCFNIKENELEEKIYEDELNANHLITGYLYKNNYYIIDSYNHEYSFTKRKHYYVANNKKICIPDFTNNLFNEHNSYYTLATTYNCYSQKKINDIKKEIELLLYEKKEIIRFKNFKLKHFSLLKKLAYLVPTELERTKEKEKVKKNIGIK